MTNHDSFGGVIFAEPAGNLASQVKVCNGKPQALSPTETLVFFGKVPSVFQAFSMSKLFFCRFLVIPCRLNPSGSLPNFEAFDLPVLGVKYFTKKKGVKSGIGVIIFILCLTLPETNCLPMKMSIFPGKYHQNGGCSMAMLVSGRVNQYQPSSPGGMTLFHLISEPVGCCSTKLPGALAEVGFFSTRPVPVAPFCGN